jgi:hypothetical protein
VGVHRFPGVRRSVVEWLHRVLATYGVGAMTNLRDWQKKAFANGLDYRNKDIDLLLQIIEKQSEALAKITPIAEMHETPKAHTGFCTPESGCDQSCAEASNIARDINFARATQAEVQQIAENEENASLRESLKLAVEALKAIARTKISGCVEYKGCECYWQNAEQGLAKIKAKHGEL